MILADKIIEERKKLGLSQEELAERLSVSRQAVSKWESAQSVPDLQKIIAMSELFSVSTDYLLKDEIIERKPIPDELKSESSIRHVSMEEASEFLSVIKKGSKRVALGVFLCIFSPVLLILFSGVTSTDIKVVDEMIYATVGLIALFVLVAVAVFLFIGYASKAEKFKFLKTEKFETAYGVSGFVKEKKEAFESIFIKYLSLGTILCILSPLPLIITGTLGGTDNQITFMTALLLCIVSIGVYMIVRVGIEKSGYQIILQEAEYSKSEKQNSKTVDTASSIYWCLAVAGYLSWSFITNDWGRTWILWPIVGVLFLPFITIVKHLREKNE